MELYYRQLKTFLSDITHLPNDMLHIYGGVICILFWLILFKGKRGFLGIILIVIGETINELIDMSYLYHTKGIFDLGKHIPDFINTVFLPVLIWLSFILISKMNLVKTQKT